MSPYNINNIQAKNAVPELEDRVDVNANAVSPFLKNDETVEFKADELNGIDGASAKLGGKSSESFVSLDEVKNTNGNYILNNTENTNGSDPVSPPPPPPAVLPLPPPPATTRYSTFPVPVTLKVPFDVKV